MDLTRTSWPLGWTPSESYHGNPQGLLRMDNLHQEEDGTLALVKAPCKVHTNAFPAPVERIFSKHVGNLKVRWLGLTNSVIRSRGGTFTPTYTEVIPSGGAHPCFGSALGEVFCISGGQKKKDNSIDVRNLGIKTPDGPPQIQINSQPLIEITSSSWTLIEGTDFDGSGQQIKATAAPDTFKCAYGTPLPNINLYDFDGGRSDNPGDDTFSFVAQIEDPSLVRTVTVEFYSNFGFIHGYSYEFQNYDGGNHAEEFLQSTDSQSVLKCKRSEFTRFGQDSTLDWSTIVGFRIIYVCTGVTKCFSSEFRWWGGAKGQLSGSYLYKEVFVNNTGHYNAKSGASPASRSIPYLNGSGTLFPDFSWQEDPQINEVWIYRRSSDVVPNALYPPGVLDQYYRVMVFKKDPGTGNFVAQDDNTTDIDALELNLPLNEFTTSLQDIDDQILCMEGLYNERMLYMSTSYVYLSERLNPDAIDERYTLKASGDPTEINLWLKKVSNNSLLLGTSKDIYEIAGTLADMPDGTIDAQIRPIGESYPPIAYECASYNGAVFYMSSDGVRATSGSNSELISWQLSKLFQDDNRYGIAKIAIYPNGNAVYPICASKNRLYVSVPMVDGTRWLLIYDLITKSWRVRYTDPISLFTEDDDTTLGGYGNPGDFYLRDLEFSTTVDSDGIHGQKFVFQTVFDDNGQPRNRKDTFTLKITADTSGQPVQVYFARALEIKAGQLPVYYYLGEINTIREEPTYFKLKDFTLDFRYSIKILGNNIQWFRLFNFSLEYDARPEQLNYLVIPPNNLETPARKRFITYAFTIDTMGHEITFQPIVDNQYVEEARTVRTWVKQTYIYYFDANTVGTDISGILDGGVFEFYGPNLSESVSEKMPAPATYLVIPDDNFGTPNRKRHSSYKFQINTNGGQVLFTPYLDYTPQAPLIVQTFAKRTVEYYYANDTIAIDIGAVFDSLDGVPFEYYGTIVPQNIEVMPPKLEEFRSPETNFGVPAKKRIRTLPLEINTFNEPVTITPFVDGIAYPSATISTPTHRTAFYYFDTDVFGIDFCVEIKSTGTPFEFYGLLKPEDVEVLPVSKKYDQLGPVRFDKIAKLIAFRTRLVTPFEAMPFSIYIDEDVVDPTLTALPYYTGSFKTVPNTDQVYQVDLPKNVNGTVIRITLGGTTVPDAFHRYEKETLLKVLTHGMQTDGKWVEV